jgi:TolA-binding protein
MDSREAELNRVGKKIRDALDTETAAGEEVRLGRQRFVEYVTTRNLAPSPSHRREWFGAARRISVGMLGVSAVAAAIAFWWRLPISFQVDSDAGPAAVAGTAGDLIEANAVVPTAIRFSEGSSIVLERGGRLRVLALESNGARVLVEKGAADVAIAHRHGPGRWRFEAGPVSVDVTGTRFRVDWSPEQHSFGIELKEGSVIVGGDCVPTPRRVQRGDNLHITCGTAPATTTAKAELPAPAPAIEAKPAPVHAAQAVAHRDTHATDDGDWRALVAAGHYAEAVRAAERAGWSRVCRSANAVELLSLADAARLSGETSRAVEALQTLRQRFPASTSAATAAFSLGRLAFEKRGAYAEAARWFATYLNEQPQGPLMGDAIGRLMEARDRGGDRPAARRDAERYLQRFPEGPYAGTARVILAE